MSLPPLSAVVAPGGGPRGPRDPGGLLSGAAGADALAVPVALPIEDVDAEDGPEPRPGTADASVAYGIDLARVCDDASFTGKAGAVLEVPVPATDRAGAALPAFTRVLPSGDVLVHAVADAVGPTGQRFEGTGVVPDEAAPPTRAALLAGRDPALDAALRWIAAQRR